MERYIENRKNNCSNYFLLFGIIENVQIITRGHERNGVISYYTGADLKKEKWELKYFIFFFFELRYLQLEVR